MYSDPMVVRYLGREPRPDTDIQALRERLRLRVAAQQSAGDGLGMFAIEERSSGRVVGAFLIKMLPDADGNPTGAIEIGWHLRRDAWGRGYATEAASAGIQYGFETLGLTELHAVTYPENEKSIAVAKRLGMEHVGQTSRFYGLTVEHFVLHRS
jgi:RimJ/RimL family protein N-acetyltransferase